MGSARARPFLPLFGMLLAIGLATGPAGAATIRVPGDARTIQAGINMAVGGDTVRVGDGIYSGDGNRDIYVDRNIVLESDNGPARTIISCEGTENDEHRGFLCVTGSTGGTIDGFTVTGGYVGDGGGAIKFIFGSPLVTNCTLRDNEGGTFGGAIYVYVRTAPTIDHCTIMGNTAVAGAAIICFADSAPTITDCVIVGNHGWGEAGGCLAPSFGNYFSLRDCRQSKVGKMAGSRSETTQRDRERLPHLGKPDPWAGRGCAD